MGVVLANLCETCVKKFKCVGGAGGKGEGEGEGWG